MAFVSYKVENDKQFQKTIDDAFKEVSDLRVPFKNILRQFYQSRKAIFKLKGAGQYSPFKGPKIGETRNGPLVLRKPSTKRKPIPSSADKLTKYEYYKKLKYGFTYPLLKASGDLEKSITDPNDSNAKQIISPDSLVMITTIPYANYHQQDNPDGGNSVMPTRKFFFIGGETSSSNRQLERYIKIIQDYVTKTTQERFK